jgi:hypothetical protein
LIILLIPFFGLIGCNIDNKQGNQNEMTSITFNEKQTIVTLYETTNQSLFNIQYQFTNKSDMTVGPFYINYVFHDNFLTTHLKNNEYSPFKGLGAKEDIITLNSGEIRQGGVSIEVKVPIKSVDKEKLKDIVRNNAVEIQLVNIKNNIVFTNHWIRNFAFIT